MHSRIIPLNPLITPEELAALPIQRYAGEIVMPQTAADLERATADLLDEGAGDAVVGFDTETRPAFRAGEMYLPSLFQAATARAVYVFPLQRLDCSQLLARMLHDGKVVKAGVSVADDLKKLKLLFPFEEAAIVDLGTVA